MHLTMNRFRVKEGQEHAFEALWRSRETKLPEVPGFVSFHLLRGPRRDGYVLYASHTFWESRAAFEAWTRSSAFREAHRDAGRHGDMYDGPPELEVFDSVQHIAATAG